VCITVHERVAAARQVWGVLQYAKITESKAILDIAELDNWADEATSVDNRRKVVSKAEFALAQ